MKNELLELDLDQLTDHELIYTQEILFNRFHLKSTGKQESRMILNILKKWGIDIQGTCMVSDFEYEFNEKFNQ